MVTDGTSVTKVEVNMQAPRLHYVHPTYFEAGKPMEFVACGSNLLQPKFRYVIVTSSKHHDEAVAYSIYLHNRHKCICLHLCIICVFGNVGDLKLGYVPISRRREGDVECYGWVEGLEHP